MYISCDCVNVYQCIDAKRQIPLMLELDEEKRPSMSMVLLLIKQRGFYALIFIQLIASIWK